LLVPPADPEALASAVTRILTDNALREAMATAARETALSRFDLRRQADELATLLKKTLDERTQRGD
jgi:glycosyltransferase involved in cell wall biosynthesis